jgi:hypothetical protein
MFGYLYISVTNVPPAEQWDMLREIQRLREGQADWTYLWAPYWGQRILLPRFIFLEHRQTTEGLLHGIKTVRR